MHSRSMRIVGGSSRWAGRRSGAPCASCKQAWGRGWGRVECVRQTEEESHPGDRVGYIVLLKPITVLHEVWCVCVCKPGRQECSSKRLSSPAFTRVARRQRRQRRCFFRVDDAAPTIGGQCCFTCSGAPFPARMSYANVCSHARCPRHARRRK